MKQRLFLSGFVALIAALPAVAQEPAVMQEPAVTQEPVPAFQASFTPEHALYPRSQRIQGLTLSFWGENPQTSLAIGLVNGSTGESAGLSLGLANYAESYAGLQWSFANFAAQNFTGWQGGPLFGFLVSGVNFVGGDMRGLQLGAVNLAGKLSGLQLGLVNYCQRAESGVQVGVINLIAENQYWFSRWPNEVGPGMVLVNWRF